MELKVGQKVLAVLFGHDFGTIIKVPYYKRVYDKGKWRESKPRITIHDCLVRHEVWHNPADAMSGKDADYFYDRAYDKSNLYLRISDLEQL